MISLTRLLSPPPKALGLLGFLSTALKVDV